MYTREQRQALAIWSTIIVFVLAFIVAYAALPAPESLDEETLCPRDLTPPLQTVILIDKTDPLTETHLVALAKIINSEKDRLPRHGHLQIVVLESELSMRFSLCRPGDGNDANVWKENPERLQQAFEKRFAKPLNELLAQLTLGSAAPHSPIMEAIETVAIGFAATVPTKRLIVVSDMLQNTGTISHYHQDQRAPGQKPSSIANLQGVAVEILYLQRDRRLQDQAHHEFWKAYFAASKAASLRWTPIPR